MDIKFNIDFDKISSEVQNRIDFVIGQMKEKSPENAENFSLSATIAKQVCQYSLELYHDELLRVLSYWSQNSQN